METPNFDFITVAATAKEAQRDMRALFRKHLAWRNAPTWDRRDGDFLEFYGARTWRAVPGVQMIDGEKVCDTRTKTET